MNTLDVVTALKILSEVNLTVGQFAKLLAAEDISEEMVDAELNKTDAVIEEARNN